ncbi:IGL1 protein, partial [Crotophaga sulcirostris]|nr:IGL1 protein [Crotophaga sulcirostris]
NTVIHWYQQKEGKAPQRILYYVSEAKVVDDAFQASRYTVENFSRQKLCILTMHNIIPDDTATYYCAYWRSHCALVRSYYKVFRTGTKLIISDKGNSPPANSEILQKKHNNQITYVCLIEKFYPEIIRVTWTDGEREVKENVVKGDTWKPEKEDKYSIGSWLTVPAENKDKTFHCTYQHESGQKSLPTKGIYYILFCLMFVTDHILHRTAYLVYIVLLLKSSMYYLIVLFFIYR